MLIDIRTRREAMGMTRAELAKRTGVCASLVTRWEAGTRIPATERLPALAQALSCEIGDLFEHTGKEAS